MPRPTAIYASSLSRRDLARRRARRRRSGRFLRAGTWAAVVSTAMLVAIVAQRLVA